MPAFVFRPLNRATALLVALICVLQAAASAQSPPEVDEDQARQVERLRFTGEKKFVAFAYCIYRGEVVGPHRDYQHSQESAETIASIHCGGRAIVARTHYPLKFTPDDPSRWGCMARVYATAQDGFQAHAACATTKERARELLGDVEERLALTDFVREDHVGWRKPRKPN